MGNNNYSFNEIRRKYLLFARPSTRLKQLESSFASFFKRKAAGGIVLLIFTLLALIFANVPSLSFISSFWDEKISISFLGNHFNFDFRHAVNDGFMVIFFFVVGLEIKRELVVGELSSVKQASLPIIAAIGGMIVPALLYSIINYSSEGEISKGWGIPMATDIAFAIGILAMMGNRVPISLKIFLTALAIVDDLGAILVIALFYPSHDIQFNMLMAAAIVMAVLLLLNWFRVFSPIPYLLLGIPLWYFILQSGVHATIAGVLLAVTVPSRSDINQIRFYVRAKYLLRRFKESHTDNHSLLLNNEGQEALQTLSNEMDRVNPLITRFEHKAHPWVTFIVMPVFALANAGVKFSYEALDGLLSTMSIGIFVGLFFGKPIGITLFSFMSVKLGLTSLPSNIRWSQIISVGFLAGIGFTMSIFINGLAFSDQEIIEAGKMSILVTSAVAGIVGWILTNKSSPKQEVMRRRKT